MRIAVWAPNFHAAEALLEGAMLKAVELANRLAREYVLGCAGAEDPAVLHANHLVGAFLRELEFVDGHDDSHILRFREVAKYSQQVDLVADVDHSLATFAIADFPVEYKKDKKVIPAQVLMADFTPFDPASVDRMQRSQLWDCPDGEKLLDSCKYKLMLSDFLAAGLEYKLRCRMLARWLEIALELFDDCVGVWIPASGKLLTRQQLLNNPYRGDDRFLYFGVNIRFFNIQGTEDMMVDSLGLYAVGLPDVQYHFHGLDPNDVVDHAYRAVGYLFGHDAPVKPGETIGGLKDGQLSAEVHWPCRYEKALLQPEREVMDICPGEYASGNRPE